MLRAMITVASLVCCFAAPFGIKMMDLHWLITVFLVTVDIGVVMLILIYAMGQEETES